MLGANRLIFALDPKLEMDAETLVLHSGPKFLCFIVYFYKYFWFWYQTEIVSEKVYVVIWTVLEITSLKALRVKEMRHILNFRVKSNQNSWKAKFPM